MCIETSLLIIIQALSNFISYLSIRVYKFWEKYIKIP